MGIARRIKQFWKARKMTRLSSQEVAQLTLYPNEPRKKLSLIRKELLYLCSRSRRGSWDQKSTIKDYFNMGIDRAGEDMRQYVFSTEIFELRNSKQPASAPVLKDKWITSEVLQLNGVATSHPIVYKTPFISVEQTVEKLKSSGYTQFFAKEVAGCQGNNAFPFSLQNGQFTLDDGTTLSDAELCSRLNMFIVEPYIDQHEQLTRLYPHGVSSLRIVTVCDKGAIEIILASCLVGAGGLHMSNFHQGGLRISIDITTGELADKGLRTMVKRGWYTAHPDTGVQFKGFKIPYWSEVLDLVIRAHQCFPTIHSVGWDVAITSSGPVIIEGNHMWTPHSFQYNNGPGRWLMEKYFLK